MTTEVKADNIQNLIIRGTKEAIDLEVQRLRDEGWPVLVWRDGKVVDISKELELQEDGRAWFLTGVACLFFIPVFLGLIYFDTKWLPIGFIKFLTMLFGIMSFGWFGLGAWYGNKRTRRHCLIFMAVLLPLVACLIYSYFANGFFADF